MRVFRSLCATAFSLLFAWCSNPAHADALKDKLAGLEVLPLAYGVTQLKVNHQDVLITKGIFRSETAGGGDGYSVMVKDENGWQFVKTQERLGHDVMIWSAPHTGEDTIASIYFMVPKRSVDSKKLSALYILKAHRKYKRSPVELAPTQFDLLALVPENDDFGIRYFITLFTKISKNNYSDSAAAVYHELHIRD